MKTWKVGYFDKDTTEYKETTVDGCTAQEAFVFVSKVYGPAFTISDFDDEEKPVPVPKSKPLDEAIKKLCWHVWEVDYVSPFVKQEYYSCKLCKMKREEYEKQRIEELNKWNKP